MSIGTFPAVANTCSWKSNANKVYCVETLSVLPTTTLPSQKHKNHRYQQHHKQAQQQQHHNQSTIDEITHYQLFYSGE